MHAGFSGKAWFGISCTTARYSPEAKGLLAGILWTAHSYSTAGDCKHNGHKPSLKQTIRIRLFPLALALMFHLFDFHALIQCILSCLKFLDWCSQDLEILKIWLFDASCMKLWQFLCWCHWYPIWYSSDVLIVQWWTEILGHCPKSLSFSFFSSSLFLVADRYMYCDNSHHFHLVPEVYRTLASYMPNLLRDCWFVSSKDDV